MEEPVVGVAPGDEAVAPRGEVQEGGTAQRAAPDGEHWTRPQPGPVPELRQVVQREGRRQAHSQVQEHQGQAKASDARVWPRAGRWTAEARGVKPRAVVMLVTNPNPSELKCSCTIGLRLVYSYSSGYGSTIVLPDTVSPTLRLYRNRRPAQ
jgi:hypothetical protein